MNKSTAQLYRHIDTHTGTTKKKKHFRDNTRIICLFLVSGVPEEKLNLLLCKAAAEVTEPGAVISIQRSLQSSLDESWGLLTLMMK